MEPGACAPVRSSRVPAREFPRLLSLTLTHACPLRCEMCGQHSETGYVRLQASPPVRPMRLDDWRRLVDEAAAFGGVSLLLRGGEPLVFPGIIDLISHVRGADLPLSIDTSGVRLEQHAEALATIGGMHVTVSVDGPPAVHDAVRGVPGTFAQLERGIRALRAACERRSTQISLSLTCTLTPRTVATLEQLPDVARRLAVPVITLVPVYWVPTAAGEAYEEDLAREFGDQAISWRGFPRGTSELLADRLLAQLRAFRARLGDIETYPYMPLTNAEYVEWFDNHETPVGVRCRNAETLLDVRPDGQANFCVDFCDFTLGDVREHRLGELWRSERAEQFRARLRRRAMPVCQRCGAKYMGEQAATRA